MLDPFRGRAPRTMRFCTILALCGASLIVVGGLGVLILPVVPLSASTHTALTYVMGFMAAAGFLPLITVVFILWIAYEEGQRRGDW